MLWTFALWHYRVEIRGTECNHRRCLPKIPATASPSPVPRATHCTWSQGGARTHRGGKWTQGDPRNTSLGRSSPMLTGLHSAAAACESSMLLGAIPHLCAQKEPPPVLRGTPNKRIGSPHLTWIDFSLCLSLVSYLGLVDICLRLPRKAHHILLALPQSLEETSFILLLLSFPILSSSLPPFFLTFLPSFLPSSLPFLFPSTLFPHPCLFFFF